MHVEKNKQNQRRKQAERLEKFHRITSNRKSILGKRKSPNGEIISSITYVPNSNRSVIATWRKTITRMAIKICRIERICETSSNSVKIDERIRNIFVGNADEVRLFSTTGGIVAVDSVPILFIVAKSNADTTGCLIISSTKGKSAVCLISEENSSRRVPM